MKLAAAISWYQEPVEALERTVKSIVPIVDQVVALDGRWEGFDEASATTMSPASQYEAIVDACDRGRVTASVLAPHGIWKSQVAKRSELMRLAAVDSDWILVIDGDEYVERADPAIVRQSLELTSNDVATVMLHRVNEQPPFQGLPDRPYPIRRFYRSRDVDGTPVTVKTAHNGYWLDERWLNGDRAYVKLAPALDLSRVVTLTHDQASRDLWRRELALAYYRNRKAEKVEAWR